MWKQRYRRAFKYNQIFIASVCLFLAFYVKMTLVGIIAYFLVMQLGALLGAMWTSRLVGKFERRQRDHFDLKLM